MALTDDEWFANHPWLDRKQWLAADHSGCAIYPGDLDYDANAPEYQQCRSTHCPQCGKRTGSQGHIKDGKCPVITAS